MASKIAEADPGTPRADTLLHKTAREGSIDQAEAHVGAGSPVDALDTFDWTPLMHACSQGHSEIVDLLLRHMANPNARDMVGRSPLILAASHGHKHIVQGLLDRGADIAIRQAPYGWTALERAARAGHLPVVELLMECGCHLVCGDDDITAALSGASHQHCWDVVAFLLPFAAQTHIEKSSQWPDAVLAEAAGAGKLEMVRAVLHIIPQESRSEKFGQWALESASRGGHEDLVILLKENGIQQDDDNWF